MDHLQTEARNPASTDLDELSPLELVRLMNAEDAKVASAVATQAEAIARAIDVIADRLRAGGRLVYAGAGTSGRLGVLDATECPPTFNAAPGQVVGVIAGGETALTRAVEGAEDQPELGERDLAAIHFSAADVLVGIATSGRTPYVLGALGYARRLGAFTIGLACNADAELIGHVDLPIVPVVGPEVLSGSTRLKAGTATKLVLNMLSTGAMVRLGKTFGNLMVDLRATNDKLRARTNRIVRQLTGLNREDADALLDRCGRELKTALVTQLARITPDEARARLKEAGGRVRAALGSTKPAAVAPDLVLGIDGGGTHTSALLARVEPDGRCTKLGQGTAGPSNLHAVGAAAALRALDTAVTAAFAAAGRERVPVASACLGLAGAGRPEDQATIRAWAERVHLAAAIEVTGDAPLLLAAGTPAGWGVALVAGTGSMAFARAPDGRTWRVGGWGYLLGDEGSGYALGLAGLRAVCSTADRRTGPTALTDRLLTKLGVAQPADLVRLVHGGTLDRPAIAALAPVVLAAAEAGDEPADILVNWQAGLLAAQIRTAAKQLDLHHRPFPLVLAGGLLLGSPFYSKKVLYEVKERAYTPDPVSLVPEPAEGAVRLALAQLRGGNARA